MDIKREPKKKRTKYLVIGGGVAVLVLLTIALGMLPAAAPSVDRSTLMIDSVQRGTMVRAVRAPGTLVPEQVHFVSALTAGRVEQLPLRPGAVVHGGTMLLLLSNPDVQLEALDAQRQVTTAEAALVNLQTSLATQRLTQQAGSRDGAVAAAQAQGDAGMLSAGLVALSGPGVEIILDDAPTRSDGVLPAGATPDDLVIHQSDVQAVVNAVWASGADGVAIMGKRLVATSAVRCVGNVLLLQGRTYSPPFVVTAIGNGAAVRSQLSASREVRILQQAVDAYGLTFSVRDRATIALPAYDGPLDMSYATPR